MSSLTMTHAPKGLEGVVATTSKICYIDGEEGVLAYRGIDIHELADHSTFEETCYLLWNGALPTKSQLKDLHERLAAERKLDPAIIEMLRSLPKGAMPMDVLRTAVSALGLYDPDEKKGDHAANVTKSIRLTSQIAMIVAAYDRLRKGKDVVKPDPSLSHSANFLLMLNGEPPSKTAERALDIALILHADHELNASTFAARVTAATLSDMHSAITSAIGALKGPLHGGAGEAVMRTLMEIGEVANVDAFTQRALAEKRRLMGFGHRVYKAGDPRAAILRGMAEEACRQSGQFKWYEMAVKLHERIGGAKGLIPNVDFYSAPLFYSLGIPVDLFTPVIAAGRIAGWSANIIEQHDDNRLIRPRADYVGPARRTFAAIGTR
jgi:citrate synthase